MFTSGERKEGRGKIWIGDKEVHITLYKINKWDFPGGPVGKEPALQCRGHGFNPWSGN